MVETEKIEGEALNTRELNWEWESEARLKTDKDDVRSRRRCRRTIKQFKIIIKSYFNDCLGFEGIFRKSQSAKKNRKVGVRMVIRRGEILPKEILYIQLGITKSWIRDKITSPTDKNMIRYKEYRNCFEDALELIKAILMKQALNNPQNFIAIKWYLNIAFNIKEDLIQAPNQPIILHFKKEGDDKTVIRFDDNFNEFKKQSRVKV